MGEVRVSQGQLQDQYRTQLPLTGELATTFTASAPPLGFPPSRTTATANLQGGVTPLYPVVEEDLLESDGTPTP